MNDMFSKALELAATSEERSVKNLRALVRVPSLTGEEGLAQSQVAELLEKLSAETEVLPLDVAALFQRFPGSALF